MKKIKDKRQTKSVYPILISILIIIVITGICYAPALRNDFTNWDDDKYVYENPILKLPPAQAIPKMFAEPYYLLYTPLTLLSYGLDYWYQGKEARYFIRTQIGLHILNSILVFLLILLMLKAWKGALLGALFFALHPMHVESVAWISERKDVLYALFFLASMLSWLMYLKEGNRMYYALSWVLFLGSCFSKPSAVILPVILLTLDYLYKERIVWKNLWEKTPFFILSLIFGWILLFGVETQGGKTHSEDFSSHSFEAWENVLLAIYSYVWYPVKMIWPYPLSAFYAYPLNTMPLPWYIHASPVVLILIAGNGFWAWKKKHRPLLFALAFYTIAIFLFVKILTTVGALTYDRYFYVASFGFCYLAGWSIEQMHVGERFKKWLMIIFAIILLIWAGMSRQRTEVWKNSYVLMSDMLRMYPLHLPFAYNNRGLWLMGEGRLEEAVENFSRAIQIDPAAPNAYLNTGKAFGQLQMPDSAIKYLEISLKLNPGDSKVYNNLGNAYGIKGDFEQARSAFQKSLSIDSNNDNALYNLAVTYALTGDTLTADSIMVESARKGNQGARNSLSSRGKPW